jgi:coniferyl-aldehyde dehydrogenase
MLQFLQVDMAFGGVGASGFGRYHGREGFETFSHLKSVFTQRGVGNFTGLKLLYPPYGRLERLVTTLMGG